MGHGRGNSSNGAFKGNDIVPGITPFFPVTFGSTVGTTDASALMTATIDASMAIVTGAFGVAVAGITNPLLASLCVQAAQLANSSVTAVAIANLAVGTAAIASLAVDYTKIANATITGAQIASATIAGANIGSATIAQANMASASIGAAQIQSLAVTDAKINDVSAGKLTAGTISATISITSPTITCTNGFTITAGGLTTSITNGAFNGLSTGLVVSDGASFASAVRNNFISVGNSSGSASYATLQADAFNHGSVLLSDGSGNSFQIIASSSLTSATATAGSGTLPAAPVEFLVVKVNGTTYHIPLYN